MIFKKKLQYLVDTYPNMQKPALVPNQYQQEQIERKFGMFLHFGINTFNNTEWSDGKLPIKSYKPRAIDADSWVKTAYEAGMNYVVLITKHHDGFCLWDTHTTQYSVNYSPVTTDIVKEVSVACRKYGVKLGLYYSLWDRNAECYKDDAKYLEYMVAQLTELLDGRYGEVVELWFDGAWDKSCRRWGLDRLYDLTKTLQPKCQIGINHTVGKFNEKAQFPKKRFLPENYKYGDPLRMFPSDFRLWDPNMCREDDPKIYTFNNQKYYLPFEMTICSRKEFSWFYSDTYDDKPLMDANEIIKNYKILDKTNNLLLINLPPNYDGKLTPKDVENLKRISKELGITRVASI